TATTIGGLTLYGVGALSGNKSVQKLGAIILLILLAIIIIAGLVLIAKGKQDDKSDNQGIRQ
ncbi:MAG TPA: hypothetical protein VD996_17965, partial [Chitinophagaceae bacterium]|nr:hypothetical protein [Chitinophagaceae bacterium]